MMSGRSRRSTSPSNSSPQALSALSEPEKPRIRAMSRSKLQSNTLTQLIAGQIKTAITRTVKKAEELLVESEASLKLLCDPNNKILECIDQEMLSSAATLAFDMKDTASRIETLDMYIYEQFQMPEILNSADRERHLRDVTNVFIESGADQILIKINTCIENMIEALANRGQPLSGFQHSFRVADDISTDVSPADDRNSSNVSNTVRIHKEPTPTGAGSKNLYIRSLSHSDYPVMSSAASDLSFMEAAKHHTVAFKNTTNTDTEAQVALERNAPNSDRAEFIRSRITKRSHVKSSVISESSNAKRYEQGDTSESETESLGSTPPRTKRSRRQCAESRSRSQRPQNEGLQLDALIDLLPTFDENGDLEFFERMFNKFVMSSEALSTEGKYTVLRAHIKGEAQQCISRAKDSAIAIATTFVSLNRVYGKVDSKHNLMQKLQQLPFHQSDPEVMRLDVVAISVVLQQMIDRGVPADDYWTIWEVARKLPEDLRKSLAKYSVKIGDSLTHAMVIDRISRDVETLVMDQIYKSQIGQQPLNELPPSYASVNSANANLNSVSTPTAQFSSNSLHKKPRTLAYIPSDHPAEYIDPATNLRLEGYYAPRAKGANLNIIHRTFPYCKAEKSKCRVCYGKHHEIRCTLSSAEFRRQCKKKRLCPICTEKHGIKECTAQFRCGYCDGLHHMGGCPAKEYYRNKENYPAGAKPVRKFFRGTKSNKSQ